MRVRFAPSRGPAVLFVLALGALVGAVLFGESARVPLRTPFVPREARAAPVSAPLEGREAPRGSRVFRQELVARDPAALLAHEEVQLLFESQETSYVILGARLELRGTGCVLEATTPEKPTRYPSIVLRRSPACAETRHASGSAALDLVIEARGEGALALLGFEPAAPDAEPAPLQVPPTRSRPEALDVRGAFIDYPETAPRIVLLSHMWRFAPGIGWLVALAGLALGLACAGCLVFPTQPLVTVGSAPSAAALTRCAAGAALFALSLTLGHAVLQPPLSGPDEPYHLLGFADLVKDRRLADDIVLWMGQTHLWRTRQQPAERFRTIDVGRPFVVADEQLRPTEVAMRSAILAALWRAVRPLAIGAEPAPRALLALRLVNALVFALALAAAAALAAMLVAEPYPQWLVFPFLFVPSLPFFAMHVSETATLCSVYVLLATSLAVQALDGPRTHWCGLPLGLATGLMLAGGRSPWSLLALVCGALAARAVLGTGGARSHWRPALVFWGGFGLGAAVFALMMDTPYRLMTEGHALHYTGFLPGWLRGLGLWLLAHPAAGAALVTVGAPLEAALARPRQQLTLRFGPVARRVVAPAAAVLAIAVVLSLLGSLVFRYPQLPMEATYTMPPGERVGAVLATMATMFRLTQPNFLLASSFWVGFGWLDTLPRPPFQGLLIALVGLALVVLLLRIARGRQVRRLLWLVAIAAGALVALVLYTASTQDRISTLVGRHLIGWYLAVLAVIGGALTFERGVQPDAGAPLSGRGSWRAALLLVAAGVVHAYCLCFVLQRYF